MINILIAEDHALVRIGFSQILKEMYKGVKITEASTFEKTISCLLPNSFDLLLININIPGSNHFSLIEAVRAHQPKLPILVFSGYNEEAYAIRYLKMGANGFIHKESESEEIKKAIQKALNGDIYTSEADHQRLLKDLWVSEAGPGGIESLSNREMEIMKLLIKGMSPSEIKILLNLQLSTISTYKSRIFEKMGVSNVISLAEKVSGSDRVLYKNAR